MAPSLSCKRRLGGLSTSTISSKNRSTEYLPTANGALTPRCKDDGLSMSLTPMALDVAKLVLSLTESAAVAGSPIKAAIGGVLKILELFDKTSSAPRKKARRSSKSHGLYQSDAMKRAVALMN
ncbi:hypothetical protein SCHPADRAFT_900002 [Schizopora paradoxa]|uniref:Uncharacterized protein n=1 Tax=Schizopora paradoxa TaxID=27342 RepID=A0A0H2S2E8_9AGAM|nr:hypothetical protein SCHPADRAFT_900002 [Schizopora paradoxa]